MSTFSPAFQIREFDLIPPILIETKGVLPRSEFDQIGDHVKTAVRLVTIAGADISVLSDRGRKRLEPESLNVAERRCKPRRGTKQEELIQE